MMQHNSVDSSEALIASPTDSNEKIRDDSMAVIYFHSHWNPLSWRDNEANIAATAVVTQRLGHRAKGSVKRKHQGHYGRDSGGQHVEGE
mmetsp:Transcript_45835/g.55629  ORF Transcript_45835/g.55629 Transcript_45835/m.55629 type:complete len:89 (+) Transcript_45835:70-336(+)